MSAADAFQEDDILGKAFDRRLLGRLLRYAWPYRARMLLSLTLILLVTGLSVVGPYIGKLAIDGPLSSSLKSLPKGGDVDTDAIRELCWLGAIFAVVSVALIVLRFIQTYTMAQIGQKVMYDLRMNLFSHLQSMPLSYYDRNPVGRLVTRITSDIEALNELLASGVVTFVADVMVLVGIAIALLAMNVELALVTLAAVPFLLLATFVFRKKARDFYRQQRQHLSHLNAFTQESIQGMNILQVFHQEANNQSRYETINRRYLTAFLNTVRAYSIYFPTIEVLSNIALVAIIWFGGQLLEEGELTWGVFYYFWIFLGRFFQPIRDMAERYNILQSAMAAAERVFGILDTPPGMEDLKTEFTENSQLRGRVEFENVWFAYNEEEYVLRGINFVVEPGEVVAIVGATGSGKSTIINLMSRLYDPQRGRITIDGVNVRAYQKQQLRHRIGIVLQDVFLFSRSVKENIRLGDTEITDEQIESAARHVNADRFIQRLENRYEEVLTERGGSLSVGEKQLLAFARVLAHDPDFLVLDEATAHVDTETERLIQDALGKLLANRTSIVIAHRLSTIRRADRIVVLHKGEIREIGSHRELLKNAGIYARLHELQYKA